ncbi:hypothetical protein ACFE04_014567 [Oxalis oulophora]
MSTALPINNVYVGVPPKISEHIGATLLLVTFAIFMTINSYTPITYFFVIQWRGPTLWIVLIASPLIVLGPLFCYRQIYPLNFLLLAGFTLSVAVLIGVTALDHAGPLLFLFFIFATVALLSLTVYTFWAVTIGNDFTFCAPFIFASFMALLAFALFQFFGPRIWGEMTWGEIGMMTLTCLAAITFCAHIVYDTSYLINRHTYQEGTWAAIMIYFDMIRTTFVIIKLFFSMFTLSGCAQHNSSAV